MNKITVINGVSAYLDEKGIAFFKVRRCSKRTWI